MGLSDFEWTLQRDSSIVLESLSNCKFTYSQCKHTALYASQFLDVVKDCKLVLSIIQDCTCKKQLCTLQAIHCEFWQWINDRKRYRRITVVSRLWAASITLPITIFSTHEWQGCWDGYPAGLCGIWSASRPDLTKTMYSEHQIPSSLPHGVISSKSQHPWSMIRSTTLVCYMQNGRSLHMAFASRVLHIPWSISGIRALSFKTAALTWGVTCMHVPWSILPRARTLIIQVPCATCM